MNSAMLSYVYLSGQYITQVINPNLLALLFYGKKLQLNHAID